MLYDDKSELLQEIAAGEDTLLEFKEVVFKGNQVRFAAEEGRATKVIAEVFVSMANTEGGLVVFGVNKYRDIIGISEPKRDLLEQFVVQCALDQCVPQIDPSLDWVYLPGTTGASHLCLKVYIPRARFYVHQTSDGRFLKRVGSHRIPIPAEQLGRLLASKQLMLPFEERPAFGAGLEAIDRDRFETYHRGRFGKPLSESGLSYERVLANLKLAILEEENPWRPTNVGLLIFSDRPDNHLPGAYVDLAVYDHDRDRLQQGRPWPYRSTRLQRIRPAGGHRQCSGTPGLRGGRLTGDHHALSGPDRDTQSRRAAQYTDGRKPLCRMPACSS
jgi:predicted HTH transcriptional regulator